MHADIDMSGRIEETSRPTAVALANGVHYSLFITATEKRRAIAALRRALPHRNLTTIHIRIFSILLFLLLRYHLAKLQSATIDPEYPGHEATIKNIILTLCRKHHIVVFPDQVIFKRVGKKSPSHTLAYGVYRGKQIPDRVITTEEIATAFRPQK